jgi:3-oxoacyl-[acyl-carrier-protein] synthase II
VSERRVMVTGLGVCASVGTGVETFWDALVNGRSGIGPFTHFDASDLRVRIAGEVLDADLESRIAPRTLKRTARFTQLALVAAQEALGRAGLPAEGRDGVGIVMGSGIGGFEVLEREHVTFLERGPGRFAPLTVPMVIPNMAAGVLAMETECRGPNLSLSTACATGAHAIGTAMDLIRSGRCEVAIAGASESTLSPFAVDGYCQLRALSTRNDEPQRASRPFDRDRDGFVIAEGAGVVVLESEEHARRRGAELLAEVAGFGMSADGHHLTSPDPEGRATSRALQGALADAGVHPSEVDVVNAHGTSTPINDPIETRLIRSVFGDHADELAVHATKSMTGHSLGASAAIEAVVSVLTISRGVVHPTANLENPDPECDLDYVPGDAREMRVGCVVSNSFAFGGHNAVLVFRRAG